MRRNGWVVRVRRALALVLLFCTVALHAPGATAAESDGDIVITVTQADTGKPISLARVRLVGDTPNIGYTDARGIARFESVGSGVYRASVTKRGFHAQQSEKFSLEAGRRIDLTVVLQPNVELKKIGSVTVKSSAVVRSDEVKQDDPLRYLSGSLRDALADLPGVSAFGDAASIEGRDPSLTGYSLDGVAIPGFGAAGRGINGDLASGASANGATGSLNFLTLAPTATPQSQATLGYASNNDASFTVATRGSLNNLGYVFQHSGRGRTGALDGFTGFDQSGTAYAQRNDSYAHGDLAKLRWSPALTEQLTLTATTTHGAADVSCTQTATVTPCGGGAGLTTSSTSRIVTVAENAGIGAVTVVANAAFYAYDFADDEAQRLFLGTPTPRSSALHFGARAASLSVNVPNSERLQSSLFARLESDASTADYRALMVAAHAASQTSSSTIGLEESYRPTGAVTIAGSLASQHTSGGSNAVVGLSGAFDLNRHTRLTVDASRGSQTATTIGAGNIPTGDELQYDCLHGIASGTIESSLSPTTRDAQVRASIARSGKVGSLTLTAWDGRSQSVVVPGISVVSGPASLAFLGQNDAGSPLICGSPIDRVALQTQQVGDELRRGAILAGRLTFGRSGTVSAYYATSSVQATGGFGASPIGALAGPGMQLPGIPLHRAGVLVATKLARGVDLIANAQYTAENNPYRLPAYTLVNAGFSAPLRSGSLTIVGNNLTNRYPGPFAGAFSALPLARYAAAPVALPGTSLAPRSVAAYYSVKIGALGARKRSDDEVDPDAQEKTVNYSFKFDDLPDTYPADALTPDTKNETCTPTAIKVVRSVLAAVERMRASAEAGRTADGRYPETLPAAAIGAPYLTLRYQRYDDGRHYVIRTITASKQPAVFALLPCLRMHNGDSAATVGKRRLYLPDDIAPGREFASPIYSPLVGFYVAPLHEDTSEPNFRKFEDPVPLDPFALDARCPAQVRPLADAIVADAKAALAAGRAHQAAPPAESGSYAYRSNAQAAWLEIGIAPARMLGCLSIVMLNKAQRAQLHIDDARKGDLSGMGFEQHVGFYTGFDF